MYIHTNVYIHTCICVCIDKQYNHHHNNHIDKCRVKIDKTKSAYDLNLAGIYDNMMSIYICIYIYMYICIYVYLYVHIRT